MYARNVMSFLLHVVKEGQIRIDPEDEITRQTLLARGGEVVHPAVRDRTTAAAAGRSGS